ncbi:TRAP transporter substrate-binding protein [Acidimangrovimonas sediminis]|uniref:TRAP transporter substrate-binding protein n=1 Tax=Acidimangrovimonas sediminis TaxID=2056283 RepID=UPI001E4A90AC|nr:TRAP transporter substrate-binding protein [Acidimangrovimonas sediminis]
MSFLKAITTGAVLAVGTMYGGTTWARTLSFALTPPLESHYGAAAKAFAETLKTESGGKLTVNISPGGALGGEREVLEGMQIGTIDAAITSTGPVGNFVPDIYALDFPYLFKDTASARKILDGPIGQDLLGKFDKVGLVGLAWGENGFRELTNSVHPIKTPEDLKGLKVRTMENQVHIAAFKAVGAAPTPMSWTEVITALQQGTIDGQENPIPIIVSNKLWESQKYVSMTDHVYSPALIVMSKITWDSLSQDEQGWVRDAATAAVKADRAWVDKTVADGIATMKSHGMQVVEHVDKAAFAKAMEPAYTEYAKKFGVTDLVEKIRKAQEQ